MDIWRTPSDGKKITRPFGSGETNTHITIQKSKKKTNKTKNKSKE